MLSSRDRSEPRPDRRDRRDLDRDLDLHRARSRSRSRSRSRDRRDGHRFHPYAGSRRTATVQTLTGKVEVGTRVFVGNLSYRTGWQELKDHMKRAGEVRHADILIDRTDRHAGSGLVEFATAEDAANAIRTLQDTDLGGRMIFLREDREDVAIGGSGRVARVQRSPTRGREIAFSPPRPSGSGRSPLAGLLDPYTYNQMYQRYADMVIHGDRGPEVDDYQRTLQSMSTQVSGLGGRDSNPFAPKGSSGSRGGSSGSNVLYVGNLTYSVSWQTLKDVFRDHGFRDVQVEIQEVDGRPKGAAIVKLEDAREAARAITELHDFVLEGRRMDVHYDKFARR